MANKEEVKNKAEQMEGEKTPELTAEVLTETAEEVTSAIEKKTMHDQELITKLSAEAMEQASAPEELAKIESLEKKAEIITEQAEAGIEQEKMPSATEHLPNRIPNSKESEMTEIIPATEKIQKRFDEKITPRMKAAMALVCGNAFNKGEYDWELVGSNCYIPHTEHSEKIPDDLDVIFSSQDVEMVHSELSKLKEQGLIKDLSIDELKDAKGEKGDIKIHCWIKGGDNEDDWVEMEAFAQNMATEVSKGEASKSLINLGLEKHKIEVVEANGVKINIGDEKTAEELYLKNITREFKLYDLKGWENRGYLNTKALQRIFNVVNLDSQETEESIQNLIDNISNLVPQTDETRETQATLNKLWNDFKKVKVDKDGKEINGTGLVNFLSERAGLEAPDDNDREKKTIATEKGVDLISKETSSDMRGMSDRNKALIEKYQSVLEKGSAEEIKEMINDVNNEMVNLSNIESKYKLYLSMVNKNDKNDFCVYAALPRLTNQFVRPLARKALEMKKNLRAKL